MTVKEKILSILKKQQPRHPDDVAKEIMVAVTSFTGSKWLVFDMLPRLADRKTFRWKVYSKENGFELGEIKWYAVFRCYSFYPKPDCVFENVCLTDIANFICEQMREWRKERQPPSPKGERGGIIKTVNAPLGDGG